jgi:hypothetical protein
LENTGSLIFLLYKKKDPGRKNRKRKKVEKFLTAMIRPVFSFCERSSFDSNSNDKSFKISFESCFCDTGAGRENGGAGAAASIASPRRSAAGPGRKGQIKYQL